MGFLTDSDFNIFKDVIYKESGIHFSDINRPILDSRIKERLKFKKLENPQQYYNIILKDENELKDLLDTVTTNLTSFFRNEAHFETLQNNVLTEIIERNIKNNNRKIKIWSAGCSTGEEAYTIAMILYETLKDISKWEIEILASDLSLKALIIAKEGVYTKDRITGIKNDLLSKYFDTIGESYKAKFLLKKLIRFDYHNLMFDNGERNIDIIFCRNVIIYFDKVAQEGVINRLYNCLNQNGYLFIGHSESLLGMSTKFKFHKIGNACIYKK